jgi:hypothetical protein
VSNEFQREICAVNNQLTSDSIIITLLTGLPGGKQTGKEVRAKFGKDNLKMPLEDKRLGW